MFSFRILKYFFKDRIQKKINKNEKLAAIDDLIEKDGWKMLMMLRNVPIINSMFLNYICGITKMTFSRFAIASLIGRLPTSIMYVYIGYMARYAYGMQRADYTHVDRYIIYLGLFAAVGSTLYLIYLCKKTLKKKAPSISSAI